MATPASALRPVREDFQWDVFISYRSPDRPASERIARKLTEMGLKVWWDDWEVRPGSDFQSALWEALRKCWATIVLVGPSTVGGWQEREVKAAIDAQVKANKPVIPVFLPEISNPDKVELEFLGLYSRVVFERSLDEQPAYNRLSWGITGINPDRPVPTPPTVSPPGPPPPAPRETERDQALTWLGDWLRTGNVTFFLGMGAAGAGPQLPPRSWEIARELLGELRIIGNADVNMLPPVDIAATFFAIAHSDPVLENRVINLIQSRSAEIPASYRCLASVIARLVRREKPRGRSFQKQLVLTPNIHLMVERALLRERLPFTRVVQHKSDRTLYVTDFHDVGYLPSDDQIDDFIAGRDPTPLSPETVTGSKLAEPILYKMCGSQDLAGSCALTRPQLLTQARMAIAEHLIPAELQKIAANTPIVFLGTGLLNSDFQYSRHTVLFEAWQSDHRKYLIELPPDQERDDGYRRMETGIWDKIKDSKMLPNLTTVEESSSVFLQGLLDRIARP